MSDGIANLINADELRFEPAKLRAYYQGREIVLTKTQLNVLQCIHAKHPNFVANEDILNAIWPSNKEPNLPQQHISALNKVLPKYGLHVHSESDIGYQIWQGAHIRKQLSASRVDSKQSSIEVFRDWREADKIISKATKSLFILDSYFGRSGDMEPFIIEALGVRTTRLKISIYMADPQKNFGAQRFKEKERPKGRKMLNKQLLKPYKRVLDSGNVNLLALYRKEYQHAYDGCINEIVGHFDKQRVKLRIYKYPTMPATRLYVVDDTDYIFGCFPLLAHNPAYTCFHLKKGENLSAADTAAVNQLVRQVKIIRKISDQVWPKRSRAKAGRRASR